MSAIDIAQNYTRRGWHCVPIATKEKGPKLPGWQDLRINEAGLRTTVIASKPSAVFPAP